MARNKTKDQKIKSAKRRTREAAKLSVVYTLDESHLRQAGKIRSVGPGMGRVSFVGNLFSYDPKLILQDLAKTVTISIIMFTVLGVIYFYLAS